jgi:hypothetical protein
MKSHPSARSTYAWPLLVLGLFSGCQTVQLRIGSINQAGSYGNIQEQQVLDNLAKFVYDINSLPTFAFSGQGNNAVTDQVSLGSTTTWERIAEGLYGWFSSTLEPFAQRQANQNWVLQPVNDPRRLDLMRCAYQQVVRANLAARGVQDTGCCPSCPGGVCPDCEKRFNTFYTGKTTTPTPLPGDPADSGAVTNRCLGHNPVWFAWGCKKDMPKCCKCLKYGHYCGVYVWVLPGGEDELTKLTLAILDYAVNFPAAPIVVTKTVVYNVGPDGLPIATGREVGTVSATIPIDAPSISVLKADIVQAANTLERQIEAAKAEARTLPKDHPRMGQLNAVISRAAELAVLRQRAASIPDAPTLPAPYVPSIDVIGGPGLIQLQNRLQSVQPVVPLLAPPPR